MWCIMRCEELESDRYHVGFAVIFGHGVIFIVVDEFVRRVFRTKLCSFVIIPLSFSPNLTKNCNQYNWNQLFWLIKLVWKLKSQILL